MIFNLPGSQIDNFAHDFEIQVKQTGAWVYGYFDTHRGLAVYTIKEQQYNVWVSVWPFPVINVILCFFIQRALESKTSMLEDIKANN